MNDAISDARHSYYAPAPRYYLCLCIQGARSNWLSKLATNGARSPTPHRAVRGVGPTTADKCVSACPSECPGTDFACGGGRARQDAFGVLLPREVESTAQVDPLEVRRCDASQILSQWLGAGSANGVVRPICMPSVFQATTMLDNRLGAEDMPSKESSRLARSFGICLSWIAPQGVHRLAAVERMLDFGAEF
jgi:hypothetical protein